MRKSQPVPTWMRDALKEGFSLLQAGQPEKAAECCQRVLTSRNDLPEAHFLVGLVALELNSRKVAIEAFGSVTKLDSTHGPAWANLARLFMMSGQPARADKALANAVEHADDNPVVLDLIGLVSSLLGNDHEALDWYARAVAGAPENVGFLVNYANCQMHTGELEGAESTLRKALKLSPGNANAHWILSGLRKADDRNHIDEMQEFVASGRYPAKALAFMQYGLGKELEDLEDWEAAFDAFAKGADARRSTLEYNEAAEEMMYAALERIYTRDWLDAPASSCTAAAPIFVVGQPRTGTTLVERVITAHSMVHSAGELKQFGNSVRRLTQYTGASRFTAELVQRAASVDFEKLGNMYIETSRTLAGDTPHFVDKLPSNFLYLPLILKALPNAKVVHLRRNPMDACFSSFKQLFADAYPHSYNQEEMARHHARYYGLMETWRERFGDRFFDIAYEDVARNLEPNARALVEFLGLPWEDGCLEFHKQTTAVTTASAVQVRQPAHTKSIGRWRRYEQQLEPMQQVLKSLGVPLETST